MTQPDSHREHPEILDSSEDRFRLLVEGVTDYAIFMLDPEGHVLTWNAGARHIKGYQAQEIIGQHFSKFYPLEALQRQLPEYELRVATADGRFEDEGWRVRKDGSRFWANVIITALRDEVGMLRGFAKVTRDLTQRRAHEESLRQSEERFRLLVEGVSDYAIFMLDANGYILTWNSGAERIKGYHTGEIIGQHFSKFYPQDAIESRWPEHELQVATETGRFAEDGWRIRKDGSKFWANVVITALRDEGGRLRGFAKLTRDLSERKRTEALEADGDELRRSAAELQELSRRLVEVQESERTELSRELHDRIGRNLTALGSNLEILRTQIVGEQFAYFQSRLQDSMALLESTADAIENVTSELRPPMLAEHGLRPALDWYSQEFAKRTGIGVAVRGNQFSARDPSHTDNALFRIVQEAFHDIAKYARATRIDIELEDSATECIVSVSDNGRGFDPMTYSDQRPRGGLGTVTMRERTQAIGGQFEIYTIPEGGTRMVVRIPR